MTEQRKCPQCGRIYTPHHAYRNKAPVCEPNGYCGGVWDERVDQAEQLEEARDEAAEWRMLALRAASKHRDPICLYGEELLFPWEDAEKLNAVMHLAEHGEWPKKKVTS